jgi:hypothetical protein
MIFFTTDEEEEIEVGDEEATLAEDLLDEVGDEATVPVEEEMEGFGLLTEVEEKEEVVEKEEDDEEASLDEDAEDVDFDTFDDIDEM